LSYEDEKLTEESKLICIRG
jgi:hypothetical protein